jgi:hypothetical protein
MESSDEARRIGEQARFRALSHFTAEKIVPEYESIYRRVLSS